MSISDEEVKHLELRQCYELMLHEELVNKLIKAHKLLTRVSYILTFEDYISLPKEIQDFLNLKGL